MKMALPIGIPPAEKLKKNRLAGRVEVGRGY
jgi:hypothetical protein